MKTKLYFTTFLVVLSLNTFAQLDKKTWLVGGNASFDSYKRDYHFYIGDISNPSIQNETYKENKFNFNTKVGYFVIDKFVLGISPSYSITSSKNMNSTSATFHYSTLSIGPFARYYFLKKDKVYNIFTDVTYQSGYLKSKSDNILKASLNKLSIIAGLELFFNNSAGIEFLAGYNLQKQNGDRTNFGVISPYEDKGFKIAIGFQLHLFKE